MQDHLGVGGRLHHGAVAHQLAAQRQAVGEIAVVADGEAAGIELGEQRLHVAQDGLAGGRIAHMADGGVAGQAVDHLAAGEGVADQAEAALGVKALAVEGDDAGGFLAAVLQRVQAERGDGGGIGMAEDAEHAAFLAQPVVVGVAEGGFRHGHRLPIISMHHSPRFEQLLHPAPARTIITRISAILGRSVEFAVPVRRGLGSVGFLRPRPSSTSSRWCFPGLPATATSAIGRFPQDDPRFRAPDPLRLAASGTSQLKNMKATTTITRPRASPNRKPSVRSSAPTRLSSTMSEILTVMIETTDRVPRKTPPTTTTRGDGVVVEILLGGRQQLAIGVERDRGGQHPGGDRQDLAHEAAHHGEQAGNQHHDEKHDVEQRYRHRSLVRSLIGTCPLAYPPGFGTRCVGKRQPCIAGPANPVTHLLLHFATCPMVKDPEQRR